MTPFFGAWQIFCWISLFGFLYFQNREEKLVKDEREKLADLKALRISHYVIIAALLIIPDIIFWSEVKVSLKEVFSGLLILAIYGEIFGKIYYRRTL